MLYDLGIILFCVTYFVVLGFVLKYSWGKVK